DDVSLMTKVAAKKTAGVLGDDLALNAQQVTGVKVERELPVVWAVAKGSFRNKMILVPSALAISFFAPWAVTPLLMLGGAYLCYEGFEKLAHKFMHSKEFQSAHQAQLLHALADPVVDMVALEKDKIQGAVRTDFILSAEIIVISLGTVAAAPFGEQLTVLSLIAVIMTIGVYGLVAGIVKLDDAGLHLTLQSGAGLLRRMQRSFGRGILVFAPYMMKSLSVIGTAAMFMVGGGILIHGIPAASAAIHELSGSAGTLPVVGGVLKALTPTLMGAVAGIAAGAAVLVATSLTQRIWRKIKRQ
ncbi:MAG: DUF808 domain-containing protein, partial [Burkholderiaceae bacterium]